jgi:hypothetical protein
MLPRFALIQLSSNRVTVKAMPSASEIVFDASSSQKLKLFSCMDDAPLPDPSSITTSLIVQLISVRSTAAVAKSASTKRDAMHPWRTLKHPPKSRLALWSSAFWCIITQNHTRDQALKAQSMNIFNVRLQLGTCGFAAGESWRQTCHVVSPL